MVACGLFCIIAPVIVNRTPSSQTNVGLGLDEDEFAACLASREPMERVVADIYASLGAVSSTPSFIVLKDGEGSVLRGSRPAEDFVTLLEGVLEEGGGE